MRSSYRWGIVIVAVLLAAWGLAPSALDLADGSLDRDVEAFDSSTVDWVIENGSPLTLGLDLQGGLLLQYKVLSERAVLDKLDRMSHDIEARLKDKAEDVTVDATHPEGKYYIRVEFSKPKGMQLLDNDFMAHYAGGGRKGKRSIKKVQQSDTVMRLVMPEDYRENFKDDAIKQAIETIRNRVNSLGVSEPSITRRGQSDIVVQLPGLKQEDQERAKELIGQTARLRFRLVDDKNTNKFFRGLQGKLPTPKFKLRRMGGNLTISHPNKEKLKEFFEGKTDDKHIIGYESVLKPTKGEQKEKEVDFWRSHYIYRETRLTGDRIQDARVS
ncbi:MAG: hypothetical protein ABEN55_04205, partial [Bradymonadaceae bacterium]